MESKKFDNRENFVKLIKNEDSFLLQIFTLESIDIFEMFLNSQNINYSKEFVSNYNPKKDIIYLLIDDDAFPDSTNFNKKHKIILFSNKRNFEFIPYQFILSESERKMFISDDLILKTNQDNSVSSLINKIPDLFTYSANSLNYIQCVIMMCLLRATNFLKLCEEIKTVDPEIDNSFLIQLELNWLCKNKFCKKIRKNYKITVSNETIHKICSKIGFDRAVDISNFNKTKI